jgi:hypothetical protein
VDVLPQASVAIHERVTILPKPVEQSAVLSVLPVDVTVGVPHASVASGVVADGICALQSISASAGQFTNTGAVRSLTPVTVREIVAVLPQASVAINVLVFDRKHPLLITSPSLKFIVGVPQASVAVAPSSAASTSEGDGLQPTSTVA